MIPPIIQVAAMAESLFGCDEIQWVDDEILGDCDIGSVLDRGDGIPCRITRIEYHPNGKNLVYLNHLTIQ